MSLRRTPFHSFHVEAGAKMVDFGGWHMPLSYTRVIPEHEQVRSSVGLFDVSHMGEVRVHGDDALAAVQHIVTNDVLIDIGQAQYTCMCRPDGGIVDDLIVYRLAEQDFLLCINASNRHKDFAWIRDNNPHKDTVATDNVSDFWAQLAIQGRRAVETLQPLTDTDLSAIEYFRFATATVAGIEGCIVARTGYTGEDGFEVFLPAGAADVLWPAIVAAGAPFGLCPIGLAARDTLRLEARLHLYGSDMSEETTPLEASLGWCTKIRSKEDFIGRDAMIAQRKGGLPRKLVGMTVDKRIPRPHCPIRFDGAVVGEVTSGTRSPTLGSNVALGYVPAQLSKPGTVLEIDVRGKMAEATVVRGPFYKRDY
ncbi:MAG: aminomethyltransferase [Myxococcota bacterium]|jgi:aminomethyltransferase